jgi:CRP-like cAMP-binding protein
MPGYDEAVYRTYLSSVPMFSACTSEQIDEIERLAETRALDHGTMIVREGERGDEFYVIGTGEASVTRSDREVAKLGPGDFFGELALFDEAPRNATVTSTTGITIVVITRAAFQQLLGDLPGLREQVLQGMARRLHELDAKA